MTTRLNFFTQPKFLTHLNGVQPCSDLPFEFDESDLWNNNFDQSSSSSKSKHTSTKVKINRIVPTPPSARSVPVNVTNWSKINHNNNENGEDSFDDDDDDDEEEYRDRNNKFVPPYEYLAKTRGSSLSVEQGRGRTLKGRDMCRVRNAIWKQCGFED